MTISERIFRVLDKNNKSQKDLADYTGIKTNTISDWRRKGTNPSADKIMRICDFLDVSVEWLLTGAGEIHRSRAPTQALTAEESELLENYKVLDEQDKIRVLERVKTIAEMRAETARRPLAKFKQPRPTSSVPVNLLDTEKRLVPEPVKDWEEFSAQTKMRVYDMPASAGMGNYLSEDSTYEELMFGEDDVPDQADFGIRISGNSMEPDISDGDIVWVKEQVQIENGQIGIFILNDESFCKKLQVDYKRRTVYLVSLNPEYKPMKVGEEDVLRTIGRVLL